MKRHWMTMIFAAACTATAGYSAELHARIPFDFSANGKTMAAGEYTISRQLGSSAASMVSVRSYQTRQSVVLVTATTTKNQSYGDAMGKVMFKCVAGKCAIAEVHTPGDSNAQVFMTPAPKRGETERTVAVRLASGTSAAGN